MPVLFFCFSRKECEIKAKHHTHRHLLSKRQRHQIEQLFEELCEKFELDLDRDRGIVGFVGQGGAAAGGAAACREERSRQDQTDEPDPGT